MENDGRVTIHIPIEDAKAMLTKAKSRPDMHGRHCPHFTSWAGVCTCWVQAVREVLEKRYPPQTEGSK